jgi:diguanylate cyclase (GGDEF)-like protein/PAS domain S-box-containing protein
VDEGRVAKRVGPWWLPYLSTPVGFLGFWALHRLGVLGPTPLWVLLVLTGITAAVGLVVEVAARRITNPMVRLHVRLSFATVTTTVVLYATAWGPVIAIGYVLAVIDGLRTEGSRAWWPGAAWSLVAMGFGQLAIGLGIAPSILAPHVAHAVAAGNAACLVIVLYSLGTTTRAAEQAQHDVVGEREHFRSLVQHASDVIAVLDRDLTIQYLSPAVFGLLGYAPEECVGQPIGTLVASAKRAIGRDWVEALVAAGGMIVTETTLEHRSGSPRIVEITSTLRADDTIVANVHDVTEQRVLERELRHQANHDVLTGLMNRAALIEAVEEHTVDAVVVGTISVLFVDLDGFKEVNDALGHERGDAVLVEAARRITTAVPSWALTGRLGGDEFLVVLHGVGNAQASALAAQILESLERPWNLAGYAISASIGIATTGEHPESVEDILRRADEAMYDAKRQGKGRYALARAS